jgi:flagellar basal body P-ring protein FlgI
MTGHFAFAAQASAWSECRAQGLLGKFWMPLTCVAMLCVVAGCQKFNLRSQTPEIDDDEVIVKKTVFIGDQVAVTGLHGVQIEYVGLVTNLDRDMGGDTPPSVYRKMLTDEMRKRGIKNPNTVLRDSTKALVIVRAVLPPVIKVGDRFDVEVMLPEGSEAVSLRGGYLTETPLAEQAIVPGQAPKQGHVLGKAEGPILLATAESDAAAQPALQRRGRIPGGGVFTGGLLKEDRALGLYLRNDLRSGRQVVRISDAIGKRFFDWEHGRRVPLAKAKTDQFIELKVPTRYKDNFARYIQVVRALPLGESPVEQRERMERLRKSLMVPVTASRSALELEAIGSHDAKLILKEALKSTSLEVRFYAADALAYLGESVGAEQLAEAARREPAFRVFALAALATLDQDALVRDQLKELMTKPTLETVEGETREAWSAELRYGAFRALWTIDREKRDPIIRGEPMRAEHEEGHRFTLHTIDSPGEPMVHLSRHRVSEVVLFGADQRLETPVSLNAGRHILITAAGGSDTVTISRFEPGREDRQVTTSNRLVDVIRGAARLGASYPDVAQLLVQAESQSSLQGRLEFDALPRAGRIYHRDLAESQDRGAAEVKVGREGQSPNMFPNLEDRAAPSGNDASTAETAGSASLADAREPRQVSADEESASPKRRGWLGWLRR